MLVKAPTDSQTPRQIVVIAEVKENLDLTEITIEGSWQGGNVDSKAMTAYKLGRSFRYFGYNAPPTVTNVDVKGKATQQTVSFVEDVYILNTTKLTAKPNLASNSFPLDQKLDDISAGSTLLISLQLSSSTPSASDPTYFFARKIARVSTASATHGALTGGTTIVKLNAPTSTQKLRTDIRRVEFHEVIGQAFTIMSTRKAFGKADPTANSSQLFYYGDGFTYKKLEARSLQLVKGRQVELVTAGIGDKLISSNKELKQITLRSLTIKPPLQKLALEDFPLDKPSTVKVYGNLVEVNQGKTEPQAVLGNGDSRQIFQTFKLPKAPLTYFNSKN